MAGTMAVRRPGIIVALCVALAGCDVTSLVGPAGTPWPATIDGLSALGISNGTTLPVVLFVNGTEVGRFAGGVGADPVVWAPPPLPWRVEARTANGRLLLTYGVEPGGVGASANSSHGAGSRVDLSCGRLDVWSGPPMVGPMPGPGQPGDCEP